MKFANLLNNITACAFPHLLGLTCDSMSQSLTSLSQPLPWSLPSSPPGTPLHSSAAFRVYFNPQISTTGHQQTPHHRSSHFPIPSPPNFVSIFSLNFVSRVICWPAGGAANTMEASSDEEVQEAAMQVLRNIYGSAAKEPVACAVSRWGGDPYSRGPFTPRPPLSFLLPLMYPHVTLRVQNKVQAYTAGSSHVTQVSMLQASLFMIQGLHLIQSSATNTCSHATAHLHPNSKM